MTLVNKLTQTRLKELLNYDLETGIFTWSVSTSRRVKIGDIAGYANSLGYVKLGVDKKDYHSHRLVWLYIYGEFPTLYLDHIGGDPSNNRISNLRECSQSENMKNVGVSAVISGLLKQW